MPPRFYVPEARDEESSIELPQDEAAHVTRVLRLSSGDPIRVFDGRGQEWNALIDEAGKQRVTARLIGRVRATAEPRTAMTLAVAVLKGDKMDDIVRDAVMLGVAAMQPLLTTRTEIAPAAMEKSGRIARWQRIAVSSAKQCGRAVVPDVRPVARLDEVLRHAQQQTEHTVVLVEPSAPADVKTLRDLPHADRITLVVGPEGGWTDEEVQRAVASGAMLLTLGSQTLRADAVPLVALTALRVRLEDF